jgi:ferredoxin
VKIVINWTLCDGNGNCAKAAPEMIAICEDDTPQILQASFSEEHRAKTETAVGSCPKNALKLVKT